MLEHTHTRRASASVASSAAAMMRSSFPLLFPSHPLSNQILSLQTLVRCLFSYLLAPGVGFISFLSMSKVIFSGRPPVLHLCFFFIFYSSLPPCHRRSPVVMGKRVCVEGVMDMKENERNNPAGSISDDDFHLSCRRRRRHPCPSNQPHVNFSSIFNFSFPFLFFIIKGCWPRFFFPLSIAYFKD